MFASGADRVLIHLPTNIFSPMRGGDAEIPPVTYRRKWNHKRSGVIMALLPYLERATLTDECRNIRRGWHGFDRDQEDAMKEDNYTEEEKRTLEALEQYKNGWVTHGGIPKFVDEIYADFPEVYGPLQHVYSVKPGQSKENWRNFELEFEKIFPKKAWKIVNCLVRDNRVAVELEAELTRIDGEVIKSWWGVFLTFDKDGRIICDHTYTEGLPFKELIEKPELDMVPDFKNAMQKILDSQ